MQNQLIKLKLRSLLVGLIIFTAVKFLFLMPNSTSFTYSHHEIETSSGTLVEDIIVENDHRTEEILQTFAKRRYHIRNICQTNKIGKFVESWKTFKETLRENDFSRNGKLLSETRYTIY